MRPSKSDEGLNFHLRMMVHTMTEAPTDAAMTTRTVIAACDMPEEDEVDVELVCVGVGIALLVRYKIDWAGGTAAELLALADVPGVLDGWLDVEESEEEVDEEDEVVLDSDGKSPPTTEPNRPPPVVEGLYEIISSVI